MLLLIASLHKHTLAGCPKKTLEILWQVWPVFSEKKAIFQTPSQHQTEPRS